MRLAALSLTENGVSLMATRCGLAMLSSIPSVGVGKIPHLIEGKALSSHTQRLFPGAGPLTMKNVEA